MKEREFEAWVTIALERKTKVKTDLYYQEDTDEDMLSFYVPEDGALNDAYNEQKSSVTELMAILKEYIQKDLQNSTDEKEIKRLNELLIETGEFEETSIDVS